MTLSSFRERKKGVRLQVGTLFWFSWKMPGR